MKFICVVLLSIVLSSACSNGGSGGSNTTLDSAVPPVKNGNWYKPSVSATWQWQLAGTVTTTYPVEIYDIDLFDASLSLIQQLQASGHKVICYFSAGSYENWRTDAGLFDAADLGNTLAGWPGERWLDVRSANVHEIMKSRLDLARQKGCDGVEPDNMDGYTNNSGFSLSANDQLAYNRFINNGKPVFNAEYRAVYVNDANARRDLCTDSINRQFSTLVLPLDLDDSFRFSCL